MHLRVPVRTAGKILCAVFIAMMITVSTAAAAKYHLAPVTTTVAPGNECVLTVQADASLDSLGCVECWVVYDPSLVTLLAGQEGSLFVNAGAPRLFFNHALAPDTFSVEGCLLGYRTHALTPGEVVRLRFRADAAGACPVRIARFRLWDINRVLFEPAIDSNAWIFIGNATAVEPAPARGVRVTAYPNPFNPSTTIDVRAPAGSQAIVDIHTAAGRLVRRIYNRIMPGDTARLTWDGTDEHGARMPSGIYFVSVTSGDARATHKLVLVQ